MADNKQRPKNRIKIEQIIDNEFRIGVLERIVDRLLRKEVQKLPSVVPRKQEQVKWPLSQKDIEAIEAEVFDELREKYPGVEYTPPPTRV